MICGLVLTLWSCGKERGGVAIPEEVLQRAEMLNAELSVRYELAVALNNSTITSVEKSDDVARITFRDKKSVSLRCAGTSAKVPLIGAKEYEGVLYWTVGQTQEWLTDGSSAKVAVAATLPKVGLDDAGRWTVTIGSEQPKLLTVAGEPIVATGQEPVAQVKSVEVVGGVVSLEFSDAVKASAYQMVDLSAVATANSYIVSVAGRYTFDAKVRGNGIGDVASCGYDPKIEVGEMTADWLWASSPDLISEVSYDKSRGEIAFTAKSDRGNVVIALVGGDKIVWSWHIWLTDEPQKVACANGTLFQDRNLGATSVEEGSMTAYGLYYQWGRKEPFAGGATTEASAQAFAEATKATVVNPKFEKLKWGSVTGSLSTFDDAAANPMTFIYNKIGVSSVYDWSPTHKTTLWGVTKTLNDPCPVGYKVPSVAAWSDFSSGHKYINGVSSWNGVKYGMTYTYGGKTLWFPAQGSRNKSVGNLIGIGTTRSGNYWTSEVASQTARFFYFQKTLSSSSGEVNPDLDKDRSYGYAVRCCKE